MTGEEAKTRNDKTVDQLFHVPSFLEVGTYGCGTKSMTIADCPADVHLDDRTLIHPLLKLRFSWIKFQRVRCHRSFDRANPIQ